MKIGLRLGCVFAALLGMSVSTACSHPKQTVTESWDPKTAAAYLDQRQVTWMGWPASARDHGTFCVACHTGLPYALSRPALRRALGEQGPSINERKLVENVTKRVLLWNEIEPFYKDGEIYHDNKNAQSRGTEAVLNALILATSDAQTGVLSNPTKIAFDNMWALQETAGEEKGAWAWLQFALEPWEAEDSKYYGATLAAIAVGTAPENYRLSPEIQNRVTTLRDYLHREYATQSTMNRVALLWASAKLPGLLDSAQQTRIIQEVARAQQSDGGWRLSSLVWRNGWGLRSFARTRLRADWTSQDRRSDGYATGLITLALQQAGMPPTEPTVRRALSWLENNQSKEEGCWPSYSVNQRRGPNSNVGHFMRDAATAYAVLALTQSGGTSSLGSGGGNASNKSHPAGSPSEIKVAHRGNSVQSPARK
jgi:squalene-hopene/tetraprenyl-beta-curcumene cyclase